MQSKATIFDIQLDLRRKDYASARAKCDSALKSLKGLDSVLILLARAEAIRSLSDSDLEMALKDVKKAISIDPKNPVSQLSLSQVFQAMSIRACSHGKSLCAQEQFAVYGRLDSLSIGASILLNSSNSGSFNPIFLPKEVLQTILLPLNPLQKLNCLRVSRDWKNQLTSDPTLWRSLEITLRDSNFFKLNSLKSSPLTLYALNSKDTLTSVHLIFQNNRSSYRGIVDNIFVCLQRSRQKLKHLLFTGTTTNFTALPHALRLASRCPNLEWLRYRVTEPIDIEEDGIVYDRDYDYDDEGEGAFTARHQEEKKLECAEHTDLDDFEFEAQPQVIELTFSLLSSVSLGDFKLFTRAKVVTLSWPSQGGLTRSRLLKLLKISSQTLETLVISQNSHSSLTWGDEDGKEEKAMDQVQLPRLVAFQILKYGRCQPASSYSISKNPVEIIAPNLSREASHIPIPNLIIHQGQDLVVTSKTGGR